MTDYHHYINNGDMMIRDIGNGWVEFWFKTSPPTWNASQDWGAHFDGSFHSYVYNLKKGGSWQKFGAAFLTASQDIMFRIYGEGIGWPTSEFWVTIDRGVIPPPPVRPFVFAVGDTWIDFGWGGDGGPGGSSIVNREYWWSYDMAARYRISNGGARNTLDGLYPGTWYALWAKNASVKGWSDFSAPTVLRTKRVPDAPEPVQFTDVQQRSLVAHIGYEGGRWDGDSPVVEWQFGYGLNPNAGEFFVSGAPLALSDLQPGQRYYFWARVRNAIGWSAWSVRSDVILLGGAYVKDGDEYVRAIPWVKDGGVWKVALPWSKAGGIWRPTL